MPVTADSYESLRPLAFAIAYRMLGTVSEAEDVVQEAFLRLHRSEAEVESPKAFLATVHDAAEHRHAALRARAARDLPRPVAARAAGDRLPAGLASRCRWRCWSRSSA